MHTAGDVEIPICLKGSNLNFLWNLISRKHVPMTKLLREGDPNSPCRILCIRWPHPILAKNIKFAKQGQNQANGCCTCSWWCPEYENAFFWNLTKDDWVMSQNAMPKCGRDCQISRSLAFYSKKYQYFSMMLALYDRLAWNTPLSQILA